jgi:hypothetical protein
MLNSEFFELSMQPITMENLMFLVTGFVLASLIFIIILYNVIEGQNEN